MNGDSSSTKLTVSNFNAVLMYVVTLGVGLVATQTFITAGKVQKIEGAQVTRPEIELKLKNITDKQDKTSDILTELRVDIARLGTPEQRPNVSPKPHN